MLWRQNKNISTELADTSQAICGISNEYVLHMDLEIYT